MIRRMLITGILIIIAAVSTSSHMRPKGLIGFVEEVSGRWFLADRQGVFLDRRQALPAGHKIVPDPANPAGSRIVIRLVDQTKLAAVCRKTGGCKEEIILPASLRLPRSPVKRKGDDSQSSTLAQVGANILSNEKKYVPVMSKPPRRGEELKEAVLKLSNGQIDLSPVFQLMMEQAYRLRFEPLSAPAGSGTGPITFDWNNDAPAVVTAKSLTRGLYRLVLLGPASYNYPPTGDEAWVLVVDPSKFETAQKSFNDAIRIASLWPADTEPAPRVFLRAYLENITEDKEQKKRD